MKFVRLIVLSVIFAPVLLSAQSGSGADTLQLSLDDALKIGTENSPAANVVERRLVANHWNYRSFKAGLYPSLRLDGSAPGIRREIDQIVQDDGSIRYRELQQGNSEITASIFQRLPWTNGQLFLSSSVERVDLYSGPSSNFWRVSPLFMQLSQPIMEFNFFKWQKRIAPLEYEASKKQYLEDIADLETEIVGGFFDVYIAKTNVDIAEFNVSINDTIYTISQGRFNVGNIAENELLQTELALMNARTNLERARLAYNRAQDDLRILLGIEEIRPIQVELPDRIPELSIDVQQAVDRAKNNRSDMLDYQIERLRSQRNIAQAEAESRLSTTLSARFGYNQTAETFEEAYNNPLDNQFVDVGFEIPIFRWGEGRAERQAAYANHESILNSVKIQEETFVQEVEYQVREFLLIQQQIQASAKADTIATRRFEVSKNRYLIGKIDITNLLIAQREKDDERQNYIQDLKQYWQGFYNLQRITLYDYENDQPMEFTYRFK